MNNSKVKILFLLKKLIHFLTLILLSGNIYLTPKHEALCVSWEYCPIDESLKVEKLQ
jgi:hypothetical protein